MPPREGAKGPTGPSSFTNPIKPSLSFLAIVVTTRNCHLGMRGYDNDLSPIVMRKMSTFYIKRALEKLQALAQTDFTELTGGFFQFLNVF